MITVRALLFDTFGTVVDWRGGLISRLDEWGKARGIAADWPTLVDRWRMAYPPSMQRVRTGEREWAVLDILQRESLQQLAIELDIKELDEVAADEMVRMWHELPPWPDSVAGLHRLRADMSLRRYQTGTSRCSCGWRKLQGFRGMQYSERTCSVITSLIPRPISVQRLCLAVSLMK